MTASGRSARAATRAWYQSHGILDAIPARVPRGADRGRDRVRLGAAQALKGSPRRAPPALFACWTTRSISPATEFPSRRASPTARWPSGGTFGLGRVRTHLPAGWPGSSTWRPVQTIQGWSTRWRRSRAKEPTVSIGVGSPPAWRSNWRTWAARWRWMIYRRIGRGSLIRPEVWQHTPAEHGCRLRKVWCHC